jgi:hypothetical protein
MVKTATRACVAIFASLLVGACGGTPSETTSQSSEEALAAGGIYLVQPEYKTLWLDSGGTLQMRICSTVTIGWSYPNGWSHVLYHGEKDYHPAAWGWTPTSGLGTQASGPDPRRPGQTIGCGETSTG